jgi:hypothetical protein
MVLQTLLDLLRLEELNVTFAGEQASLIAV